MNLQHLLVLSMLTLMHLWPCGKAASLKASTQEIFNAAGVTRLGCFNITSVASLMNESCSNVENFEWTSPLICFNRCRPRGVRYMLLHNRFCCSCVNATSALSYLTLCEVQVIDESELLALSSCQDQQNTFPTVSCGLAMDGKRTGPSVRLTKNGWWSGQTVAPSWIKSVKVFSLFSFISLRVAYMSVWVGNSGNCTSGAISGKSVTFQCNFDGSDVWVAYNSHSEELPISEVQVFGRLLNGFVYLPLISCSQSSGSIAAATCEKAVDGNTSWRYEQGSCAVAGTGSEAAWWSAKIIVPAYIFEIVLYNGNWFLTGFVNYDIALNDFSCAKMEGNTASNQSSRFYDKRFGCDKFGQTIKITSTSGQFALCEIQVFGEYEMLELKNCGQSSTFGSMPCERATDGKWDAVSFCSHIDSDNGWWKAEARFRAFFKKVRFFNRPECCQERLTNFYVSVDGVPCAEYKSNTTFLVKTLDCYGIGKELKISSRLPYMTLCEVQVLGNYLGEKEFDSKLTYTPSP